MLNVISKSILAFVLSFLLAFAPTLAFAREAQSVKQGFQAETTAAYNAQVTALKRKVAAANRARAAKSNRSPASVAKTPAPKAIKIKLFKSPKEAVASIFQRVHYKNQDATITQIPSRDGKRIQTQIVTGPGFEEILVDEFNTGTASKWEMKRGNTQVVASHPYRGTFSRMQVRERLKNSYFTTKYQINSDLKTYRLIAYRVDPFHVDHHKALNGTHGVEVVGEGVAQQAAEAATEPSSQELRELNSSPTTLNIPAPSRGLYLGCVENLTTSQSSGITSLQDILSSIDHSNLDKERGLTCSLEHLTNAFFDKSCTIPGGKGERDFSQSTKDMADGLALVFSSLNGKSPSRYLQCANDHGYAFYAARMQANFARAYNDALAQAGEDSGSANDCKVKAALPKESTSKPFLCSSDINTDGQFNDNQLQQITFGMNSKRMSGAYHTKSPAQAYASIFFHEMLHQAGIPEEPDNVGENVVADLQMCCASPDSTSSEKVKKACESADDRFKVQLARQTDQNKINMFMPGSYLIEDAAAEALGATGGDDLMGRWYQAINADPAAKAAWADLQGCSADKRAECITKDSKAIEAASANYFDGACKKYQSDNHLDSNLCRDLKGKFNTFLSSSDAENLAKGALTHPLTVNDFNRDIPISIFSGSLMNDEEMQTRLLASMSEISVPLLDLTSGSADGSATGSTTGSAGSTSTVATRTRSRRKGPTGAPNGRTQARSADAPPVGTTGTPKSNGTPTATATNGDGGTTTGTTNGGPNAAPTGADQSGKTTIRIGGLETIPDPSVGTGASSSSNETGTNNQPSDGQTPATTANGNGSATGPAATSLASPGVGSFSTGFAMPRPSNLAAGKPGAGSGTSLLPTGNVQPASSSTTYLGTGNGTPIVSSAESNVRRAVDSIGSINSAALTLVRGAATSQAAQALAPDPTVNRFPASTSSGPVIAAVSGRTRSLSASGTGGGASAQAAAPAATADSAASPQAESASVGGIPAARQAPISRDEVLRTLQSRNVDTAKVATVAIRMGADQFSEQLAQGRDSVFKNQLENGWSIIDTKIGRALKNPLGMCLATVNRRVTSFSCANPPLSN